MKRFFLWIIGVALGVVVLLGAVMAVSYSFTGEGARPAADVQFGGQALEVNGSCWQVPLVGGVLDRVFAEPDTLTVQKLGTLYDAHPALALPDWATYTTLTIETDVGSLVFAGSAGQYEDFLFPANGSYKATMTVWRLPADLSATQFDGGTNGSIHKNWGQEHPARPTGWYRFSFRFTLQASANVELSAERVEQGGIVGVAITGMAGDTAPTLETDLGSVSCTRSPSGWRAYIPAAYNASAGAHEIRITVNGETISRTLTGLPKDFGTAEVEAGPAPTEAANTEFRNNIWPLYELPVREKLWSGGFICPAENYLIRWISVRSRSRTASRVPAPTPPSSTPFPATRPALRRMASSSLPGTLPSPATPSSSTTAAACAATFTACRPSPSAGTRPSRKGRPSVRWAKR